MAFKTDYIENNFKVKHRNTFILLFLLSLFTLFPAVSFKPESLPRILFISSYSPDFPTVMDHFKGIKSVFKNEKAFIQYEFMDSKKIGYDGIKEHFKKHIKFKLSKLKSFDIILSADDNALQFILEYRDHYFKNIPVVFFGINNYSLMKKALTQENITGIFEKISMQENLQFIKSLNIKMMNSSSICHVITDKTPTAIGDFSFFINHAKNIDDFKYKIIDMSKTSYSELKTKLNDLPKNDTLFLISAYTDVNGCLLNFMESLNLIKNNFSGPIFHSYLHGLGHGILGGKMINHYEMSRRAAQIAVKILLNSKKISKSTIDTLTNKFYFDFNELKKRRIPNSFLPKDSIILFKPNSILDKYKIIITIVVLFILLLIILVIFLFLSYRKKRVLEKSLRHQKDHISKTLDSIKDFVITTDINGSILKINKVFQNKFSIDESNYIGKSIKKLLISTVEPLFENENKWSARSGLLGLSTINNEIINNALECKTSFSITSFIYKNRIIKGTASRATLEHQNTSIIVFTFTDLTDEFVNEIIIKNQNMILHSIFDMSPYFICITDNENKFLLVNKAFEKLSGWTMSHLLDKTIKETALFQIPSNDASLLESLYSGQKINNSEIKIRTANLSEQNNNDLSTNEKTIIISSHNINYMEKDCTLSIGTDISEPLRLTQELNHATKLDALGQLAGGMTHDFNNVLCGILNSAELLKSQINDEELVDYVDIIIKLTAQASDLTSGVLSFTRKSKLEKQYFDFSVSMNTCMSILKRTIDKKVKINNFFNVKNTTIFGNENLLLNSLLNLAINASHAMPEGGDLTFESINVNLDKKFCKKSKFNLIPGTYVKISVTDTGTGIDQKIINKIFDTFFTTKKEKKGTGIGLSSVMTTVKRHNGSIEVVSEFKKGSTFIILLPVDEFKTQMDEPDVVKNFDNKHESILIIDDEKVVRNTLKIILKKEGYKVLTAENAVKGIKTYSFSPESINLVILDMIMPDMNGEKCFYELMKINPDVKIIICSGFTEDVDINILEKNGLAGFIRKPFRKKQIIEIVDSVLKQVI